MYDKNSRLSLFSSLNKQLETDQNSAKLSLSIKKLRSLVVAVSKNIERLPQEEPLSFHKLKRVAGSENRAKVILFGEKLNQACDLSGIDTIIKTDEIDSLKELIISLYIAALEEHTNDDVVNLFKQKINDTISDIQNTTEYLLRPT